MLYNRFYRGTKRFGVICHSAERCDRLHAFCFNFKLGKICFIISIYVVCMLPGYLVMVKELSLDYRSRFPAQTETNRTFEVFL